jgi:2-phosphosulfolactate phosphatase
MKIETCYSPLTYPLFHNAEAIVVVIDVLRATSAMVTAIANGATSMIPVATVEEAKALQVSGCLAAAERNGEKLDGFDFGNSPISYLDQQIVNKTIAISTTNGTQAIAVASEAKQIVIGAFLNANAVIQYLKDQKRDVVFLCAGWKNKFNLEDTLFAGHVANELLKTDGFETECDSTIAAGVLYEHAAQDLFGFLDKSSHRNRLSHLNLEADIRFCLQLNLYDTVPVSNGDGVLVSHTSLAKV